MHFLHVNGVKKPVPFYSLDVILSIGYRVNSKRAIAFRQWSTKILKAFIVKGFAINEKLRREQLSDLRQLVMEAVDFARSNNRTILPVCSYAKAVLTRTDEYHDVLLMI